MWPIEGMNPYLKKVTMYLPLTKSIEAIRSLNARNWEISHPVVWQGFISILTWIVVAILITMLSLRLKHGIKAKR
jgi:ABC-type polysaccharide/polyol phosphate export permease